MVVIKGLCEAGGKWRAEYRTGWRYPIACWVLVPVLVEEYPDGLDDWKNEVQGLIVDKKTGKLVAAEDQEGFVKYLKV